MLYKEKMKDIFKVKDVDLVCHCIAQDAHMGAGIAVTFRKRYPGLKQHLKSMLIDYPSVVLYNYGRSVQPNRPVVANIITKAHSYENPFFVDFEEAIRQLRNEVDFHGYKDIAMPMLGAGLDGLSWENQVLPTIHKYFKDSDVTITVYFTKWNQMNMGKWRWE